MTYYFAYGSNMNYNQMIARCPNAQYFGKGFLADYKLAFTRNSKNWNGAVADILVSPGDIVWGVIYSVSDADIQKLDVCEGHPTIYKRKSETVMNYNSPPVELFDQYDAADENLITDNKNNLNNYHQIEVEVYEVVNKELDLMPNLNYLTKLQDAAFENCFPKEYQEMLYQFGLVDYNDRLQKSIDALLDYQVLIEMGNFPMKVKNEEEWGGANLVITGDKSKKERLNRDYPSDLVILTPHWRELSWLVTTLYWDEKVAWQIDYTNKHYVLEQLGVAATAYQKENPNDTNSNGICLAVLYKAYSVFISDFYKMY